MKYEENVLTFLRKTDKPEETLLAVLTLQGSRMRITRWAFLSTENIKRSLTATAKNTAENGMTNQGQRQSRAEECDEREESIRLTVPALGVTVFSCTPEEKKDGLPKREQ